MHFALFFTIAVGGLIWLSWGRISKVIQRLQVTAKYGCGPPATLPTIDPVFGLHTAYKLYHWVKTGQRLRQITDLCFRGNHTVDFVLNGTRGIWTTDPRNIHHVATTASDDFPRLSLQKGPLARFFGPGMFSSNGETWAHARKLARPTFSRAHIADRGLFAEHCELMIKQLPKDGSTVQMGDFFSRLILDASTHFIFGESAHTQRPEMSPIGTEFKSAFEHATASVIKLTVAGPFAPFAGQGKFEQACTTVHKFVDFCLDRALKSDKRKEDNDNRILVYDLLELYDDHEVLHNELFHVFFAASDTTNVFLTNIMFLLARHPDKWAKLRNAVKDLDPSALTFENLRKIEYLQWTLKEVLRLHSPGPSITRTASKPTILPYGGGPDGNQPVALATGDTITLVFGGVQRRKDIYGEDADKFRPERWENLYPAPGEFVPFSEGPKVCLGQHVAMFWAGYTLARLAMVVREVENRDEVLQFIDQQSLTVKSLNGALVSLKFAGDV